MSFQAVVSGTIMEAALGMTSPTGVGLKQMSRVVLDRLDSDRAIYFIVIFGLIVRIIPLVMVRGGFLEHENPSYYEMGLQLLRGEKFSPYWPPGVPYYLLLAHKVFGDGLLVARASMLPVYAGFSFVLYLLAKEVSPSSRKSGRHPLYLVSNLHPLCLQPVNRISNRSLPGGGSVPDDPCNQEALIPALGGFGAYTGKPCLNPRQQPPPGHRCTSLCFPKNQALGYRPGELTRLLGSNLRLALEGL